MPLRVIKVQYGTVQSGRFSENPTKFEQRAAVGRKRAAKRKNTGKAKRRTSKKKTLRGKRK